jgi:hypothetical protein
VIVQPHIREDVYRMTLVLRDADGSRFADDLLRLHQLESLLNHASSGIVARGASLVTIGEGS